MLGLAGGVGSGKSTVAGFFARRGAQVVDADALGHRALDRADVRDRLLRAWGRGILKDGRVDRGALAARAFRSPRSVATLNRIVHPPILREIRRRIAAARGWVVLDAALLFESGTAELCDRVLFVSAPRALRVRRTASRGWPAGELARRERHQRPVREKKRRADYVVDNSGSRSRLEARLRKIHDELRRSAGD